MEQALRYEFHWMRLGLSRTHRSLARRLAPGSLRLGPVMAERPDAHWVRLRPRLVGICGSDLAVLTGQSSPYLAPLTGFPIHLGHEILAVVDDDDALLPRGTRVVVRPTLACAARQLPPCPACRQGLPDLCRRRADAGLGPGTMLGYHGRLPGGWATLMWAPERQLYPVPEAVPDTLAVLTEPAAIVLAALRQIDWGGVRRTLVLGMGTMGLLTVWGLSLDGIGGMVGTVARRPHQRRMAERLGARLMGDDELEAWLGRPLSPRLPGAAPYFPAGADVVVDTVGTPQSFRRALAVTAPGGQLLVIGGVGAMAADLAPLWTRRLRVAGAWGYGPDDEDLFADAVARLAAAGPRHPLGECVTHRVALADWRRAVATALDPAASRLKVALVPNPVS
jgi:threonine dehydrogenase-like Zn-dependent dehydrogenase